MPSIQVPAASADLSTNGSALGFVQVADNAPYYPGCEVWLQNDDGSQRCLIVKLNSTTDIYLRFLSQTNFPSPNYGYSDCSAYTTATNSRIYQETQLAPVDPAYDKPVA